MLSPTNSTFSSSSPLFTWLIVILLLPRTWRLNHSHLPHTTISVMTYVHNFFSALTVPWSPKFWWDFFYTSFKLSFQRLQTNGIFPYSNHSSVNLKLKCFLSNHKWAKVKTKRDKNIYFSGWDIEIGSQRTWYLKLDLKKK